MWILIGLIVFGIILWVRKTIGVSTWIDNLFGAIYRILWGIPLALLGIALLVTSKGVENADKTSGVVIYGGIPIPVSFTGNMVSFILMIILLLSGGYLVFYGLWLLGVAIANRIKGKKTYS